MRLFFAILVVLGFGSLLASVSAFAYEERIGGGVTATFQCFAFGARPPEEEPVSVQYTARNKKTYKIGVSEKFRFVRRGQKLMIATSDGRPEVLLGLLKNAPDCLTQQSRGDFSVLPGPVVIQVTVRSTFAARAVSTCAAVGSPNAFARQTEFALIVDSLAQTDRGVWIDTETFASLNDCEANP